MYIYNNYIHTYFDTYFDMSSDISSHDIYSEIYGSLTCMAYILTYNHFILAYGLIYIPAVCWGKLHDMYIHITCIYIDVIYDNVYIYIYIYMYVIYVYIGHTI